MGTGVVGAALDPLGRRRIAGLRALADELGWYFAARDDRWVKRLEGPPFRYGPRPGALSDRARHRRARNVLTGQWGGRAAVAFDYSVRTVTSAGFGQAATADLRFAVCAIELPEPTPRLDIIAAPRFTRAARLAGRAGVELENEDFNRTFHVVCGSGRFASDVLQPRTMRRLLDDPCGTIRLAGHHAQIHRRGRLRPADVTRCLGLLGDVVSGIPAFVWADLRTGAGAEDVR